MLDGEANRELFEEQVEIILKALREESFSHRGKHYTIPPEVPYRGYPLKEITLVPRPLRQPVEVWQPIVSGSARGLDFMARNRIKGVISATAEELAERWVRDYQEAARRHGRALQLGEDLILGFRMCIDDTAERAIQRARPYFEEHAKVMAPLGMLRYSEEHVKAVAARQPQSPTTASLENGVRNRSWLCGPPGDIVAYLKERGAAVPGPGPRHDRLGDRDAERPHGRAAHPLRAGGHARVPLAAGRQRSAAQSRSSNAARTRCRWGHQITGENPDDCCHTGIASSAMIESR